MNTNLTITWLTEKIVFYPCLGYFLQNRIKFTNKKKWLLILWILNFIGIAVSCGMTYYKGHVTGGFSSKNSQTFHECFTFLNCICIFLSTKCLFEKNNINKHLKKALSSIGDCTFGIYLIHLLIMECTPMIRLFNLMINNGINKMIAVFIWCFLVMIICYGITYVLRKIPIINKLVGG